jgi:hypothetical protein
MELSLTDTGAAELPESFAAACVICLLESEFLTDRL